MKEKLDSAATCCLAPYQTALSNLGKFDLEAAHDAQVRSRIRWTEEGEASSAYFYRLVKKQSAGRLVAALHCPDNTVVNSAPDLVECFSQFYFDLFLAEQVDSGAQEVLLSNVSASLSISACDACEVSCLLRSVLLPFRAWPVGKRLDVMVFLWSFTANSGVSLVLIWSEF